MDHGINELNKLLDIFDKMSVSEYLDLYDESLTRDNITIIDDDINTSLSYEYNRVNDNYDLFSDDILSCAVQNDKDNDIFHLEPETPKAA